MHENMTNSDYIYTYCLSKNKPMKPSTRLETSQRHKFAVKIVSFLISTTPKTYLRTDSRGREHHAVDKNVKKAIFDGNIKFSYTISTLSNFSFHF